MSVVHNHGSKGGDVYYSPPPLMAAVREILGGIDLDPCSDEHGNRIAQASRYYTETQDGLAQDWSAGTCFVNPPGGRKRLGQKFWTKLQRTFTLGNINSAAFLSFSLDYLQTTQVCEGEPIFHYPTFIFDRRLQYWEMRDGELQPAITTDSKGKEHKSAPKPSCLTLLNAPRQWEAKSILNRYGYAGEFVQAI